MILLTERYIALKNFTPPFLISLLKFICISRVLDVYFSNESLLSFNVSAFGDSDLQSLQHSKLASNSFNSKFELNSDAVILYLKASLFDRVQL